jgi:hypothetical protein
MSKLLTPYNLAQGSVQYDGMEIIDGPTVLTTLRGYTASIGGGVLNSKGFHMISDNVTTHCRMNLDKSFTSFTTAAALFACHWVSKITDDFMLAYSLANPNFLRCLDGINWQSAQRNMTDHWFTMAVGSESELLALDWNTEHLLRSIDKGLNFADYADISGLLSGSVGWYGVSDGENYLFTATTETLDQGTLALRRNGINTKITTNYRLNHCHPILDWPFAMVPSINDGKILVTENGFQTAKYNNLPFTVGNVNAQLKGGGDVYMMIYANRTEVFYTIDRSETWNSIDIGQEIKTGSHFDGDGKDFYLHIANDSKVYHFMFR